ncbi:MAG TPA: tyrosine-type recombinase/integrase [bacterium]|nr:tyrosine-type recombinase/integrase [bacterium]
MAWRLCKEPNGVWYARNREGGRNLKRSLDTTYKRVAEKRLEALVELQNLQGKTRPQDIPTVSELMPEYLEHKKARNADRWYQTIECAVHGEHFRWLLKRKLDNITAGDIQNWQNRLRNSGLTPATTNRYVGIVSNLYTFALDRDLIEPHHRPRIKRLKEERQPRRYFTAEGVKALFEVSPGLGGDVALFVRLGILAGLRKEEILSLRTGDVDRESGLIIICDHRPDDDFRPKSRQERRIPVHDELWPWFNRTKTGYFFPSRSLHREYRENFRKEWDLLMRVAAIESPATPHAMRHTFGTMLARNGCSAFEIQQLMGHSSVRVSEEYIHLVGGRNLHTAVQSLNFDQANERLLPQIETGSE